MPLILNGDGSVGPLSSTEVGYLDGVTSGVQGQINIKLNTPGAWASYTPSISGTGWLLGNGTVQGSFVQIGKNVSFRVGFALGSTTSIGGGPLKISLPLNQRDAGGFVDAGLAWLWDSSTGNIYSGAWRNEATGIVVVQTIGASGLLGYITNSNPFAWAAGDQIWITGSYETA